MIGAVLAAVLSLASAAAPAARSFQLDPDASTARYFVVHKLHKVDAASRRLEGKAVIQADGRVLAMVRAPVGSFDSGDGNRDAHMQEVLDTQHFPYVVFKATGRLPGDLPAAGGAAPVDLTLTGEVELHGVKRPVTVPVKIEIRPDRTLRVRGELVVSLDAHGIERPSLLFVRLDDACRVEVDLALKELAP